MRIGSRGGAALGAVLLLAAVGAEASEIKVLCSNGVTQVMSVLGPQFEQATGNKLVIDFNVANILKQRIDNAEILDVAILTAAAIDDLLKSGKLAGKRADIARSGVGVAIRAGAPRPDISTAEAFKRTMLAAKTVAYTTQGASGQYFAGLLERLGIAEAMKPKARVIQGGRVAELVAKGEAELAVQQISELLPVVGTELAGPLPPELQNYTVFSAGIGAGARDPQAADALIKFLTAPSALPVVKSNGMEAP